MPKISITGNSENQFLVSWSGANNKLYLNVIGDSVFFETNSARCPISITEIEFRSSESGHDTRTESTLTDTSYHCPKLVHLLRNKPEKIKIKRIFDEPNLLKLNFKCNLLNLYGSAHNTGVHITEELQIEWSILPKAQVALVRRKSSST